MLKGSEILDGLLKKNEILRKDLIYQNGLLEHQQHLIAQEELKGRQKIAEKTEQCKKLI